MTSPADKRAQEVVERALQGAELAKASRRAMFVAIARGLEGMGHKEFVPNVAHPEQYKDFYMKLAFEEVIETLLLLGGE